MPPRTVGTGERGRINKLNACHQPRAERHTIEVNLNPSNVLLQCTDDRGGLSCKVCGHQGVHVRCIDWASHRKRNLGILQPTPRRWNRGAIGRRAKRPHAPEVVGYPPKRQLYGASGNLPQARELAEHFIVRAAHVHGNERHGAANGSPWRVKGGTGRTHRVRTAAYPQHVTRPPQAPEVEACRQRRRRRAEFRVHCHCTEHHPAKLGHLAQRNLGEPGKLAGDATEGDIDILEGWHEATQRFYVRERHRGSHALVQRRRFLKRRRHDPAHVPL